MSQSSPPRLERGRNKKAFLYRQLADDLRQQIAADKLHPGDRLASMDELADRYSLTKLTVRRALQELRAEGHIVISPARGCFVAPAPPPPTAAVARGITVVGVLSRVLTIGHTGYYHTELLDNLRQALAPLAASMLLLHIEDTPGHLAQMVAQAHLDAAIYIGPFPPAELRQAIVQGPPAVVLDYLPRGLHALTVAVDNREGANLAVAHLLGLGHRRLAIIAGSADQTATGDRLLGAHDALREAGIPPERVPVVVGDYQTAGGRRATFELLALSHRPTGIFSMNDEMALGCLQALQERGIRVPDEVSVVGYDDVQLARAVVPSLTTVAVPLRQMARVAVQALRDGMEHREPTSVRTVLSCTLVARNSTAPARK